MDALSKKNENFLKRDGLPCSADNGAKTGSSFSDSPEEAKSKGSTLPLPLGWPIRKATVSKCGNSDEKENQHYSHSEDSKLNRISSRMSDIEMMKERFSKLLLGEDMSGSGKGACTASAISNAITNLWATVFGQLWRLEPLPCAKKVMWRREMEWLLQVSDHIVELIPSWQTFPDGSKLEVMTCRPRSDLFINLPALRKLDNMLLFYNYRVLVCRPRNCSPEADGSASFRQAIQRQEEKWWLPVPRVPPSGLSENSRRQLNHTRECANQILKASMAINDMALAEMEVPESYLEALPKNGRSCLGDFIYRYITSDEFSSECLLDRLDLSSELVAAEIANRVEASIYVWRQRAHSRPPLNPNRSMTKSSWEKVKDFMADGDKRELLAGRAENILLCLKQRFPGLTQTTLDTSKIQSNKDVGKSILESYSRVLESMAFNIMARIDDLLYVDDLTIHSDTFALVASKVSEVGQKRVSHPFSVSVSGTPHKTRVGTPRPGYMPGRGERTPIQNNNSMIKPHRRGFGVKRVLSNYLRVETKAKICNDSTELTCLSNPNIDRTSALKNKTR